MGARVYLPTLGRFAQVDPVEGGTLNGYVYAADPVNGEDYTGQYAMALPGWLMGLSMIPGVGTAVAGGALVVGIGMAFSKSAGDNARARENSKNRMNGYRPKLTANKTPLNSKDSNFVIKMDSIAVRNVAMLHIQASLEAGRKPGVPIMLQTPLGDSNWKGFVKYNVPYGDFEVHYMVNDMTLEYGQIKAKEPFRW